MDTFEVSTFINFIILGITDFFATLLMMLPLCQFYQK
jgi:hypothetical protein